MKRRALLVGLFWTATLYAQGQATVTIFDTKTHGLAIALRTPGGAMWLIDTGLRPTRDYYAARDTVTPFLKQAGVTELAGVVISHPHADHFAGLPYLMENFRIGQLVDAGYEEIGGVELQAYRKIRAEAVARGVTSTIVRQGAKIRMDRALEADVLWPPPGLHRPDPSKQDDALYNSNSIVLRVRHGDNVLLFPGDHHGLVDLARRVGPETLLSTLLVAPHHGLNSTPAMAAATRPKVVVAACLNEYPGPSPNPAKLTAEAFATVGSQVYLTPRHGDVTVVSDGRTLVVRTAR